MMIEITKEIYLYTSAKYTVFAPEVMPVMVKSSRPSIGSRGVGGCMQGNWLVA